MKTFEERQKAMARKEKQQKKAARRMERKKERSGAETQLQGENPQVAEIVSQVDPKTLLKLVK
jgi:hypothetical protein